MNTHLRVLPLAPLVLVSIVAAPAVAQQSPTPSPTTTPHSDRACPYAEFSVDRTVINPGETVTVTARRSAREDQRVEVRLQRLSPAPEAVVRSDTSTAMVVSWPVRLGESHVFDARYSGRDDRGQCFPLGRPDASRMSVDVRPSVSIAATRNAVRDYTFTGRVLPARAQWATLYRHDGGRRVITAQSRTRADGGYRFDRRFTGSGSFGFSVGVGATSANLAGSSAVRPTVVH